MTFTTDSDGDGELDPFNAECVKYTFDTAEELGTPAEVGGMSYDHTEIISDYKVKIYLKTGIPWALSVMANPHSGYIIVDPKFIEKHGGPRNETFLQTHGDGTGPYMVKEFVTEDHTTLVANAHYRKGWEGPHIKKVVLRDIPEAVTREMLLARGDLDVANILPTYIPEFRARIKSENLPFYWLDKDPHGEPLVGLKTMYLWDD